jgi:nifR3 family TIM-barrel protein
MSFEFRPFSIGSIRVGLPVVLAPLAGYSDLAFRLLCRRHGVAYCTTEMMLDKCLLVEGSPPRRIAAGRPDGKPRRRLVQTSDDDHPVAGQLIGNSPDVMAAAARLLCEMGFDAIDLNFACPVNKALARRRGGYLMKQPELAVDIVGAVVAALDRPVTVKLRNRFYNADDNKAFWRIAEGAFEAGVAAVCVHARSVEMKYAGSADWRFIASVKRRFADGTVIGSGDVLTPADALAMLETTGVDAVAVARGALGNPWFFRQVRDLAAGRPPHQPGLAEQREHLAWHFRRAEAIYGRLTPKIMRKFGIKYARMHPSPAKVRSAFIKVRGGQEWNSVLQEFYTE